MTRAFSPSNTFFLQVNTHTHTCTHVHTCAGPGGGLGRSTETAFALVGGVLLPLATGKEKDAGAAVVRAGDMIPPGRTLVLEIYKYLNINISCSVSVTLAYHMTCPGNTIYVGHSYRYSESES